HFTWRSRSFVDIAWRLRCRSQERALRVFLIERFHRDRPPNLARLPVLRLDRNRFSNRFDRDRLSNFRSGFRRLAHCVTRRFRLICASWIVVFLIFRRFGRGVWKWLRLQRGLDGIVGILVSY